MDQTDSKNNLRPSPPLHTAVKNRLNLDTFWKITAKFNHRLNSIPLLYGSLGLSEALGIPLQTTDIDMLAESDIFTERRSDLHGALQALGFHLVDPRENEFQRDGTRVGVASDGDLMTFAGIDPTRLSIVGNKAKAHVLTLNLEPVSRRLPGIP